MTNKREAFNPFYALLLAAGILFAITACAYCVMTVRGATGSLSVADAAAADQPRNGLGLMELLDRYGMWIMLVQIGVLGVATVGAILTDDFWTRRAARQRNQSTREQS